jgi:transposase
MKKYSLFVGIDVSKAKLDVTVLNDYSKLEAEHFIVANNDQGFRQIVQRILKPQTEQDEILFCFEDTGNYSVPLAIYLSKKTLDYWMVPAIEIKRSKGLSRGKSDKSDSKDIAFYAISHLHKLRLSTIVETDLMELKVLFTEREKAIKALTALESTHESKGFLPKEVLKNALKINASIIRQLHNSIKQLDEKIKEVIHANDRFRQQNELIQSIPGVGPQTAAYLIIATKAFRSFDNWRQLACYAGVAPFQYSSGSSIKGRTKVNHMADKKLKSLLNMCALSAKKYDMEIHQYFDRKVGEGKNKMLVLNNIRCKLLSRIFAIINRNTPYVNLQKFAA